MRRIGGNDPPMNGKGAMGSGNTRRSKYHCGTDAISASGTAFHKPSRHRMSLSRSNEFSQNHGKTFQAPQSKCRSPLRPRPSERHLRKALHQIQKRNLSL
jgi:hypothetical protein